MQDEHEAPLKWNSFLIFMVATQSNTKRKISKVKE